MALYFLVVVHIIKDSFEKGGSVSLQFQNISYAYGGKTVVDDVSFLAKKGEITCLLGPSGCGKTTVLQIAAGILDVQSGQLLLDGELLAEPKNNPPPEQRPIGLVFQDGALFSHLTVEQNIGFGVADKTLRKARIRDLLTKINMDGMQQRFPNTLSGGQQQRVAFARAIAPSPAVLLLDEPFANVDIQRRKNLRVLVRTLLKGENCTAIMVTHDPGEALEIADEIVILNAGKVIQAGSVEECYDHPASATVEALLGGGQTVTAELTKTQVITEFGTWPLSVLASSVDGLKHAYPGMVSLAIRAEDVDIKSSGSALEIIDITCIGRHLRATISSANTENLLIANLPRASKLQMGDKVDIQPKTGSVLLFR